MKNKKETLKNTNIDSTKKSDCKNTLSLQELKEVKGGSGDSGGPMVWPGG